MSWQSKQQHLNGLICELVVRSQHADFLDVAVIGTLLTVHGINSAPTAIRQAMLEGLIDYMREQISE